MSKPAIRGRYTSASHKYVSQNGTPSNPGIKKGSALHVTDRQVTESRGNPVSLIGKHTGLDIGGAFRNSRVTVEGGKQLSGERILTANPEDVTIAASGFYYASNEAASLCSQATTTAASERQWQELSLPPAADLQMLRDGATAISRVAPTNPVVDLSTSLAELFREGLPSLPGRSATAPWFGNSGNANTSASAGAGGEYLNYQFGIAPLASDIRDLRSVTQRADALWDQYARNSGRGVRRRYTFPSESETKTTTETFKSPAMPRLHEGTYDGFSGLLMYPGTLSRTTTTSKRTWFSGSFTYFLPESPFGAYVDRLDRLYGLRPGVDTMYQLTPWSWLVDYFTNLGDVVENINSFTQDGLVMPYAYIMSETTVVTHSTLFFEMWKGSGWKPVTISDTITRKIQRRVPAHPFGFGISDGSLTSKQMSILAALGLTRVT